MRRLEIGTPGGTANTRGVETVSIQGLRRPPSTLLVPWGRAFRFGLDHRTPFARHLAALSETAFPASIIGRQRSHMEKTPSWWIDCNSVPSGDDRGAPWYRTATWPGGQASGRSDRKFRLVPRWPTARFCCGLSRSIQPPSIARRAKAGHRFLPYYGLLPAPAQTALVFMVKDGGSSPSSLSVQGLFIAVPWGISAQRASSFVLECDTANPAKCGPRCWF